MTLDLLTQQQNCQRRQKMHQFGVISSSSAHHDQQICLYFPWPNFKGFFLHRQTPDPVSFLSFLSTEVIHHWDIGSVWKAPVIRRLQWIGTHFHFLPTKTPPVCPQNTHLKDIIIFCIVAERVEKEDTEIHKQNFIWKVATIESAKLLLWKN